MKQELDELKNLPLSDLISGPLNAAIDAQRASALTTAAFIKEIGFLPKDEDDTLFGGEDTEYDVRQAVVTYQQDEIRQTNPGDPSATPPVPPTFGVVKGAKRTLQLPFISLFKVPTFEVSELTIDFNVKLKGVTKFSASYNNDTTSTVTLAGRGGADLGSMGLPLNVGASLKVEASNQTKFGLRYGEGHEAEYNMHVNVKAVQAAPPKGIERLLALAEKIVDASEKANEALREANE